MVYSIIPEKMVVDIFYSHQRHLIAFLFVSGGALVSDVDLMDGGHVDLLSFQQLADGENLQPGMHAPRGSVGSTGGGFGAHGFGGFFHGDEHADGGVLAVDDAVKVADV